MTADLAHPATFGDLADTASPVPVVAAIGALLGSLPDPALDVAGQRAWLTAKADLLDRVAQAAATPDLAARARACATAARHALAALPGPTADGLAAGAGTCVVDMPLSNPLSRNASDALDQLDPFDPACGGTR